MPFDDRHKRTGQLKERSTELTRQSQCTHYEEYPLSMETGVW